MPRASKSIKLQVWLLCTHECVHTEIDKWSIYMANWSSLRQQMGGTYLYLPPSLCCSSFYSLDWKKEERDRQEKEKWQGAEYWARTHLKTIWMRHDYFCDKMKHYHPSPYHRVRIIVDPCTTPNLSLVWVQKCLKQRTAIQKIKKKHGSTKQEFNLTCDLVLLFCSLPQSKSYIFSRNFHECQYWNNTTLLLFPKLLVGKKRARQMSFNTSYCFRWMFGRLKTARPMDKINSQFSGSLKQWIWECFGNKCVSWLSQ